MDSNLGRDTGEMIVKRVSVPIGLEELMEGLVKEVLVTKPDDIYLFAAKYFSQLLTHRDKGQHKVKTLSSAQSLKDQREKRFRTKIPVQATKQLSRQFSIHGDSPNNSLESPIISQKPRMYNRNEPKSKRKNTGPQTILENQRLVARKQYSRSVSNERLRDFATGNNDRKEPWKGDIRKGQLKNKSGPRKDDMKEAIIGISSKVEGTVESTEKGSRIKDGIEGMTEAENDADEDELAKTSEIGRNSVAKQMNNLVGITVSTEDEASVNSQRIEIKVNEDNHPETEEMKVENMPTEIDKNECIKLSNESGENKETCMDRNSKAKDNGIDMCADDSSEILDKHFNKETENSSDIIGKEIEDNYQISDGKTTIDLPLDISEENRKILLDKEETEEKVEGDDKKIRSDQSGTPAKNLPENNYVDMSTDTHMKEIILSTDTDVIKDANVIDKEIEVIDGQSEIEVKIVSSKENIPVMKGIYEDEKILVIEESENFDKNSAVEKKKSNVDQYGTPSENVNEHLDTKGDLDSLRKNNEADSRIEKIKEDITSRTDIKVSETINEKHEEVEISNGHTKKKAQTVESGGNEKILNGNEETKQKSKDHNKETSSDKSDDTLSINDKIQTNIVNYTNTVANNNDKENDHGSILKTSTPVDFKEEENIRIDEADNAPTETAEKVVGVENILAEIDAERVVELEFIHSEQDRLESTKTDEKGRIDYREKSKMEQEISNGKTEREFEKINQPTPIEERNDLFITDENTDNQEREIKAVELNMLSSGNGRTISQQVQSKLFSASTNATNEENLSVQTVLSRGNSNLCAKSEEPREKINVGGISDNEHKWKHEKNMAGEIDNTSQDSSINCQIGPNDSIMNEMETKYSNEDTEEINKPVASEENIPKINEMNTEDLIRVTEDIKDKALASDEIGSDDSNLNKMFTKDLNEENDKSIVSKIVTIENVITNEQMNYLEKSNTQVKISDELSAHENFKKTNDDQSEKHNLSATSSQNVETIDDSTSIIDALKGPGSIIKSFEKETAPSIMTVSNAVDMSLKRGIKNEGTFTEEIEIKRTMDNGKVESTELNDESESESQKVSSTFIDHKPSKITNEEVREKTIEEKNAKNSSFSKDDHISLFEIGKEQCTATSVIKSNASDDMTKKSDVEKESNILEVEDTVLNKLVLKISPSTDDDEINLTKINKIVSEEVERIIDIESTQNSSSSTGNGTPHEETNKKCASTMEKFVTTRIESHKISDSMNENLAKPDESYASQIENIDVKLNNTLVENLKNDILNEKKSNNDKEIILLDIENKISATEEPFVKKIVNTLGEVDPKISENRSVLEIDDNELKVSNDKNNIKMDGTLINNVQARDNSVTNTKKNDVSPNEEPSMIDTTNKMIQKEQSQSEGYTLGSESVSEKSGIVDRVAKNYVNYVIDKEKNMVPANLNDDQAYLGEVTSEDGLENPSQPKVRSKISQVSDNVDQEISQNSFIQETASKSVKSSDDVKFESNFDGSKLREELQQIEHESKLTTFKQTFNPFFLRKEIENASLFKTSLSNHDKEINSNHGSLAEAAAILKIQSMWRGFIVRKNMSKPNMNDLQHRDENSNVLMGKNHVVTFAHEIPGDILRAVMLIQRLWRGYRTRQNLKKINNRSKRHIGENSDSIVAAVLIQKMWRGFKARKYLKMKESNAVHSFSKTIDEQNCEIGSVARHSMIDESLGSETKEHAEMNTLLDDILDYPVIEEQHLIDTYQNKLLDKISGKNEDFNEDMEVYKVLTSKRIEELKAEEEKDLSSVHTSVFSKPHGIKAKLESLPEESIDESESSKLYTFCSTPSPIPCDSKIIEGKVISDLDETVDMKNDNTVEKPSQDSNTHLTENVESTLSKSLNSKNMKLLHTGELHDSLVLPLSKEITKSLNLNGDVTDSVGVGTKDEIGDFLSNAGLLHTGELHDSIVLPLLINKPNNLNVSEGREGDASGGPPEAVPVVSVNVENNAGPVNVQILQAPAAPGAPVTSPPQTAVRVPSAAHAQTPVAFPPPATENENDGKTLSATAPEETTLSATQTLGPGMGSDENSDGTKTQKDEIGGMESEAAARKIQAGFRGYQVRKQLKLKNGSSDMSISRRQMRPKGSQKETGKSLSKPKEIEEKSAVKIQAGVRGFLVRRRQKKQINT